MRTWIFIFALFFCSMRMMAQPCQSLPGKCMSINANGSQGVISQISYIPAYFFFEAVIQFPGHGPDSLAGSCTGDHLTFTRAHTGSGPFTQFFSGTFSNPSNVSGTFIRGTDTAQHFNWNAKVVSCPSGSSGFSLQTCQRNCGVSHCTGGKPPCSPCYSKCLAACKAGKNDDPTCED